MCVIISVSISNSHNNWQNPKSMCRSTQKQEWQYVYHWRRVNKRKLQNTQEPIPVSSNLASDNPTKMWRCMLGLCFVTGTWTGSALVSSFEKSYFNIVIILTQLLGYQLIRQVCYYKFRTEMLLRLFRSTFYHKLLEVNLTTYKSGWQCRTMF